MPGSSLGLTSRRESTVLSAISASIGVPVSQLDPGSSFIENGGDSMSSLRLQACLRAQGIGMSISSIFAASSLNEITQTPYPILGAGMLPPPQPCSTRKRPSPNNFMLLSKRARQQEDVRRAGRARDMIAIPHDTTEMQSSLLHSTQTNPFRNIIMYVEKHRPEDMLPLKQAWKQATDSEEIFRMRFEASGSHFLMTDRGESSFVWEEKLFDDEALYNREIRHALPLAEPFQCSFKAVTLRRKPGDPEQGNGDETTLIWLVHHAFIDGVSCDIIRSKIHRLLIGREVQPGPSYTDFSMKLRAIQLAGSESAAAFWKLQASRFPSPCTQMGFKRRVQEQNVDLVPPNRSVQDVELGQLHCECDFERLAAYSKNVSVTVPSLYYAAWGVVMARYADAECVSFGVVLSGRNLPIDGVESVIGPTLNTLPFHIRVDADSTTEQYSREVFTSSMDLMSFQWTTPAHGFARDFDSAINVRLESQPAAHTRFDPLEEPYSKVLSDVPLHIEVVQEGHIIFNYDTKRFSAAQIESVSSAFLDVLQSLAASGANATIRSCMDSVIGQNHLVRLASLGNWTTRTTTTGSVKDDLVSLFARAAGQTPSAIAIRHGDQSLTYAELDTYSSMASRRLSTHVRPGEVVCVHADGTTDWIIAIYATLKAGAVYCPLDSTLPDAVRDANFVTSSAKVFLTGRRASKSDRPQSCQLSLSIQDLIDGLTPLAVVTSATGAFSSDQHVPRPDSNAYLCFTSGSTGKPKGVLCRHQGIVAFQRDFKVRLCARPGWKVAQFMSRGFDGSIHEIFSALSYGATLVLKDQSHPFDHLNSCDAVILTPSVANVLDPASFPGLKTVYLVGEAVPQQVCDSWAGYTGKEVYNMYGPTEATCGATIKVLVPNAPVSLGIPNRSTRIYILDKHQRLSPLGSVGEVYLAGVQVAAGYIGLPHETSERFSLDSVNPQYRDEQMYKTGDLGYWTDQGELMLIGRRDRQIKLRGFRIDLDDLEVRIRRADKSCTAAAVVLKGDQLVAMVQPGNLDVNNFRSLVRQHIPSYVLPRHIVAVDSFPTSPVGKRDDKAIIAMTCTETVEGATAETMSTSRGQVVVKALREALGLPAKVGIDHECSLRELGADSISALSLSHRLSRLLQYRVPIQLILNSTTVGCLAEALAALPVPEDSHGRTSLGDDGVSAIEKEWWDKWERDPHGTSSFNVSYACRLGPSVNTPRLASAWNTILRRHRILSCKYAFLESRGLTRVYFEQPQKAEWREVIDVSHEINVPFDLTGQRLIRVLISPENMLLVCSHSICDLTTLKTLLREVATEYHGEKLAPIAKCYSQTTTPSTTARQLDFWSRYLEGYSKQPPIWIGNGAKRRKNWSGLSQVFQIDRGLYQAMVCFSSLKKVTMHQLALGAVALALTCNVDTCDITLGAPFMNRNSEEDLDVVGLFLEPLPIRIRHASAPSPRDPSFIEVVKCSSRAALSQAMPWDQLLSYLGVKPDFPNHPIFDAMVTFHEDDLQSRTVFPIDGVEHIPTWSDGAKFKLMAEFSPEPDKTLTLRLEYSTECFTGDDVQLVARLVTNALEALTKDEEYDNIVQRLRNVH
ncbi:D-alanine-poly(Phosphoribitol) ligase subunit 1 [Diaporthe helianthi]|uniref:D-alanine-poly(Phosphoribitol) ligase subunit 1 n=1 Tax=Diaporthe helianthi TaxID=158607 RepID=A0A2P5HYW2_DIAHE|nr:D-alanine-poly(Phosphoribitol) ligase subunit 1 [Diaporthe helianthi]